MDENGFQSYRQSYRQLFSRCIADALNSLNPATMNQASIAGGLGVNRSLITSWKTGRHLPKDEATVVSLEEALRRYGAVLPQPEGALVRLWKLAREEPKVSRHRGSRHPGNEYTGTANGEIGSDVSPTAEPSNPHTTQQRPGPERTRVVSDGPLFVVDPPVVDFGQVRPWDFAFSGPVVVHTGDVVTDWSSTKMSTDPVTGPFWYVSRVSEGIYLGEIGRWHFVAHPDHRVRPGERVSAARLKFNGHSVEVTLKATILGAIGYRRCHRVGPLSCRD